MDLRKRPALNYATESVRATALSIRVAGWVSLACAIILVSSCAAELSSGFMTDAAGALKIATAGTAAGLLVGTVCSRGRSRSAVSGLAINVMLMALSATLFVVRVRAGRIP
jgi:uncharacterized protein YfiM (DUF2279 family)